MSLSCIIIDDEAHAIGELTDLIEDNDQLDLKKTFMEVTNAIEYLEDEGDVDVVFCDINMPNMSGLEAAKLLQRFCRYLVFVTGYREYSLDASGENASGYLVKPINEQRFTSLMDSFLKSDKKLITYILIEKNGEFFVKGGRKNESVKIDLDEVRYITASLNYSLVHLSDNSQVMTYILLGDLDKKLKNFKQFFRINKSTIISMRFFRKIEGKRIIYNWTKIQSCAPVFYKGAQLEFLVLLRTDERSRSGFCRCNSSHRRIKNVTRF